MQSFSPGEVTPQQAHEIGKRLADEILGGQYAYILATHCDRDHIHNHFVWCAVNIETHRRYVSNRATYHRIQEVSDRLCAEYGLSVITEKSGLRGKSYTEYQADRQGMSWKSLLRRTIDAAIRSTNSFDEFLSFMQDAGYEVKHGKHISFRATGQERFTRVKTIGDNYTEERIRERIVEPKKLPAYSQKHISPTIRRMIDRNSEKVQASGGYRQWSTIHNLKAMSETLIYLQEKCNGDLAEFECRYDDCEVRCAAAGATYDHAVKQIAANSSVSVAERIRQSNTLKTNHGKEMTALRTEYAELKRIRENIIMMQGESFYEKHSQRGKDMVI